MVIHPDRRQASELIVKLAKAEITNDEFDDCYPKRSADRALSPIFANAWACYSDTRTHKLAGPYSLSADDRALFSRCIAFLESDLEYEWPDFAWLSLRHILLTMLGQGRRIEEQFQEFKTAGDYDVWPFLRASDWHMRKGGHIFH